MIKLGEIQTLYYVKKVEFGIYVGETPGMEKGSILLPRRQVPAELSYGDPIEVFVYKDSEDRLIATTNVPKITLGKLAVLRVKEVGSIGAFLDWGLEKDLLLPFKEQPRRVKTGHEYLVSLYIDKSSRLCATMKIYELLDSDSPYEKDDRVTGIVYDRKEEYGAFVAVDEKFHGLIPTKELFRDIEIGDRIEGRVVRVREDGKLDLSIREKAHIQMDTDSELVMEHIESYDGRLPFNDKCDPSIIKEEFGMSKAAFKRAVGHLLKEKRIEITDDGIRKL